MTAPKHALRDYQAAAIKAVYAALRTSTSTLAVHATGLGKTVMFSRICSDGFAAGRKILVLAHRDELIEQAAAKIELEIGVPVGMELGKRRDATRPQLELGKGLVIVSSTQTMGRRYQDVPADFFDLVILDEAHHALGEMNRKIFGHFARAKRFGVTATPDRGDKRGLIEIFDNVAHEMQLLEAIQLGWLVPIRFHQVDIPELDLSSVSRRAGDFVRSDLSEIMETLSVLRKASVEIVNRMGKRPTLVFCVSVKHAHLQAESLRQVLDDHGLGHIQVAALDGTSDRDERKRVVQAFRDGEIQILCGCDLFTEGFDAPATALVAILRPTLSRPLYCLDSETEVLTREGWRAHNEVGVGDAVAVYRVEHDDIVWQPAIAKVVRPLADGERFVRLSLPALDIRVTDQHRMVYRSRHGRAKKVSPTMLATAAELTQVSSALRLPVAAVEASEGVSLTTAELRFIGLVMSDGTINKYNGGITISQASHQPWLEEIQKIIDDCGFKNTRRERIRTTNFVASTKTTSWTISKGKPRGTGKHLRGWGDLEAFLSKDLAAALEHVTPAQLDDLLYGLWLGDGKKQPKGADWTMRSYELACGRNKVMAERLQSLCVRRGLRCVLTTFMGNGHQQYMLRIKKGAWRSVINHGHRRFATEDGRPGELVWCLQTEAGTLVARRRGKPFITGNCQMVGRGTRPLPEVVDGPPTSAERRAAIAASGKPDMLLLDFVGNSGRHELVNAIDLLGEDVTADEVREVKALLETGDIDDLLSALEQVRERRRAAERARLAREGDFFALFGYVRKHDVMERAMTEAQAKSIAARDIQTPALDFTSANQILWFCDQRREQRLCTYKQARLLARLHVPLGKLETLDVRTATEMLDYARAHHWRPPKDPPWWRAFVDADGQQSAS